MMSDVFRMIERYSLGLNFMTLSCASCLKYLKKKRKKKKKKKKKKNYSGYIYGKFYLLDKTCHHRLMRLMEEPKKVFVKHETANQVGSHE